jgi:hypothetical protein
MTQGDAVLTRGSGRKTPAENINKQKGKVRSSENE